MGRALLIEMEYAITRDRPVKLRTLLYASAKRLAMRDLEYIGRLLSKVQRTGKPIHIVMLLHVGSAEPEVEVELRKLEQDFAVKIVNLIVARLIDRIQLAAVGRSIWEGSEDGKPYIHAMNVSRDSDLAKIVDVQELRAKLRELWDSLSLERWIEEALKPPLALEDLVFEPPISSYKDFINALKWALSIPWRRASIDEVFNHVTRELMAFHIYGTRRGILTLDIESSERLREYLRVLARHGFVELDNGEVEPDTLSPYERRVIDILSKVFGGEASEEVLKEFFIAMSPNADRVWETVMNALEARALICRGSTVEIERLGIKPSAGGKSVVVLLATPERARTVVSEWRKRILSIIERDQELAMRFGYIVSAKERKWSGFTVSKLFNTARNYMETALKVLDFDVQQGLRLAKLALDVVEYYESDLRPLVVKSEEIVRRLRYEISHAVNNIGERLRMLEDLLSSYISVEKVTIRFDIVNELSRALKVIDDVIVRIFSEEDLAQGLAELWRKYRGKDFPFYFRGRGPLYLYNYKLWFLHEELRNLVDVASQGLALKPEIGIIINRLESLVNYVKSAIEQARSVAADRDALIKKLASSEILAPLAGCIHVIELTRLNVRDIEASSVEELERVVRNIVATWRSHTETIASKLSDLLKSIDAVVALEEELTKRAEHLHDEVARYKLLIDGCGHIYDSAPLCYKEIEKIGEIVNAVLEKLKRIRNAVAQEKPLTIDELRKTVLEVKQNLEEIHRELLTCSLGECKRLDNEVASSIDALIMRARSLARLVSRSQGREIIEEVEGVIEKARRVGLSVEVCSVVSELNALLRKLREAVLGSGALSNEEIEAYVALMSIKNSRKSLRLSEAVEMLSQRLGLDRAEVKRRLLSLIEKDVVDVYL